MSGRVGGNGLRAWRALLFVSVGLLALAPALAVEGTVLDGAGEPIAGARVCYFKDTVDLLCSSTDAQGHFDLPSSGMDAVRAHADGYNAVTFSAAAQDGPVVLERAPVLLVRLLDSASGERIEKGEIFVVYSSGKEKGPFPANAAGVRIRRGLPPGEIRVIGKAEGYEDTEPRAVTLERGRQVELELKLDPVPVNDAGD